MPDTAEETVEEIEQMAKDLVVAIRGGEKLMEGRWDGPTALDKETTNTVRKVAAYFYSMGYRKIKTQ